MKAKLAEWQQNRTIAYVAPLFLFLAMMPVVGIFKVENSNLPWYKHSPEQWIYPLQCLICGAALLFFWRHYTFRPFRGFGIATLAALVGIAVWILPTYLFDLWNWDEETTPKWLRYLGFQEREDSGFNPSFLQDQPLLFWLSVLARFLRMVVIVSFVEEIFWRGFLMRYLIDMDRDFWKTPFGTHSWLAYGVTTVLFMFVHQPADWMAALVYGSLAYFVAVRTKSLAACVWMHAVANLILGLFIMTTKNWGLW